MATRTISTKLAIEGESEYRASLTRINSEIKTLQSALKLTESQYQTNANSMAALSLKGEALSNLYKAQKTKVDELRSALDNAKRAEEQYSAQKAALVAKIEENNRKLAELKATTGDTSEEEKRLTEENRELTAQLEKCDANLVASEKGVKSWQMQLNNAQIGLNDLDAELQLNSEYMEEARKSADECATSIDRFGERTNTTAEAVNSLAKVLGATGLAKSAKEIAEALSSCISSSVEFESAMAGVAKTTELTDEEFSEMREAIQNLSLKIPATTAEIASVAEAAGQLGIAKNDLLKFTETMIQLGTSTNLSSTEAASALAKFANVTGMSADKYGRLGSVIVDLGNHFATTEADITNMAMRLASTGAIVGLTEPQMLAVATALSSVGIEAEAGGTAISKLLKQFDTMVATGSADLQGFANVAGMSAADFSDAWGKDAITALGSFIDGLGRIEEAGGSTAAVLNDLGIKEERLSTAVQSLSTSNGILNKAVLTANNAWKDNVALSREAATRYETTESKMILFKNSVANVKTAVGDQLNPALKKLTETGTDVMKWAADFVKENEWLAPTLTSVATALGVLSVEVTGYTLATETVIPAIKAFNAALSDNPVAAVALGITAVTAALSSLLLVARDDTIPTVKELTTVARDANEAIQGSADALSESITQTEATANIADRYIGKLKELEAAGLKTEEQQQEYHNTLVLLCDIVPELAQYINLQTDEIDGGTAALEKNTEEWKKNAIQQAYQKRLLELHEEYSSVLLEEEKNRIRLTAAEETANDVEEKISQTIDRMNQLSAEAAKIVKDNYEKTGLLGDATEYLTQEYYDLEASLYDLNLEATEAEKTEERLQKAIDKDAETVKTAKDEIDLMEQAVKNLTAAELKEAEAADIQEKAHISQEKTISSIKEDISDLAQRYKDAYDAAFESIDGQIGLFDDFAAKVSEDTDTVEKMISRWASQTENLAAYTENLKKAAEYGLDQGLILSLSDGSAESAGYLATIIDKITELGGSTEGLSEDASDFVDDFNAAFARTEEAKDSFSETVAAMETGLEKAITAMEQKAAEVNFSGFYDAVNTAFADVGVNFEEIGVNIGIGLSAGIDASAGDAANAARSMSQDVTKASKNELGENSPSTVFRDIGKNVDKGMQEGIEQSTPEVIHAVEDMAEDMEKTMTTAAIESVKAFDAEFSQISKKTKERIEEIKAIVNSTASSVASSTSSIGANMVNGMISGLNSRSSALYSTVSSIVNSAIARAKSAAAVASPSKKTTEIFENVGEGMVVGLENKRKKVIETTRSVVNEALQVDVTGKVEALHIDDRMPSLSFRQYDTSVKTDFSPLEKKLDTISEKLSAIADGGFVFDGDTVVGKWMPKIDKALGQSQTMRKRGVVV